MTQRAVTSSLKVDGLRELVQAIGKVDRAAAAELRKTLRTTIGSKFVAEAKQHVLAEGLVGKTGKLHRSIRSAVRGSDLVVRSSPALNPGPRSRQGYAPIYEFGNGGRRAFLEPTLASWNDSSKLRNEFNGYLDWISKEFRA